VFSLIAHKEGRFMLPILPFIMLMVASTFTTNFARYAQKLSWVI
jgi:hypothetical protein